MRLIEKYGYFGVVRLKIDDTKTAVEILDNFSQKRIDFSLRNVRLIQVEFLENCVVFLSSKAHIYVYKHLNEVSLINVFQTNKKYLENLFVEILQTSTNRLVGKRVELD